MTSLQKSQYIYNKILKDGYIESKEIVKIFDYRNLISAITVIENSLGVYLYDDEMKVLKSGKTEKSKSGDEYKYKIINIIRSQTEVVKVWRKEIYGRKVG